jgi:hypothetical protein
MVNINVAVLFGVTPFSFVGTTLIERRAVETSPKARKSKFALAVDTLNKCARCNNKTPQRAS